MSEQMKQSGGPEFITAKEAMQLLRLESPWTIYALRRAGKLVGYSIAGRNSLRFLKADVLALVQPTVYEPRRQHPADV